MWKVANLALDTGVSHSFTSFFCCKFGIDNLLQTGPWMPQKRTS